MGIPCVTGSALRRAGYGDRAGITGYQGDEIITPSRDPRWHVSVPPSHRRFKWPIRLKFESDNTLCVNMNLKENTKSAITVKPQGPYQVP